VGRNVIPTLILGATGALLMLGKYGGLARVFHALLPGFDLFRLYSRFILYLDLAVCLLAAVGLAMLLERLPDRWTVRGAVVAIVAFVCLSDLYLQLGDHNPQIAADAWASPPPSVVRLLEEESGRGEPYRLSVVDPKRLAFANAYYRAGGWQGDLAAYDVAWNVVHPNLNLLYGVPSSGFYFPTYPRWMNEHLWPALFNARYLQVLRSDQINLGNLNLDDMEPIETFAGDALVGAPGRFDIQLLRNPDAFPRAFLVPRAIVAGEQAAGLMADPAFDPTRFLAIDRQPASAPLGRDGAAIAAAVDFERYGPQEVILEVQAPGPCWLFLSDTYYHEWVATVDGSPVEILRANQAGRAVFLPGGHHRVTFHYRAASFTLGLQLASVGLVLVLTLPLQLRLVGRGTSGATG
jgi:hypothetical protein